MTSSDPTNSGTQPWLPPDFQHPERGDLHCGAHLRPISAATSRSTTPP